VSADRGLRLLSDLRSRSATHHAGICIMLAEGATKTALAAFDLGANEVVDDTMSPEEIALRLRSILRGKRRADQVRERLQDDLRLAMIDPLTGLFNRRYAMARLAKMANQTRLSGKPFAVMIADLDRFKSVNDRFGHAAGDSVLVEIGHRLSAGLRNSDLLARVGGEEFLIALPETDLDEAQRAEMIAAARDALG
jgi:two-component system cell cycle response regulator